MQATYTQSETLRTLLEIRDSAAMDLAVMPSSRQGTNWALDRQRDIDWANRQLARLGYTD